MFVIQSRITIQEALAKAAVSGYTRVGLVLLFLRQTSTDLSIWASEAICDWKMKSAVPMRKSFCQALTLLELFRRFYKGLWIPALRAMALFFIQI